MSEAGPSNTAPAVRPEQPEEPQRINKQIIVQRLQMRKSQICALPREQRLLKLAIHSACQENSCNCCGWKTTQKGGTIATPNDPCKSCAHTLCQHTSHLSSLSEEELNRLLGMTLDAEYIYNRIHHVKDVDMKQIYYNLFGLLKAGIFKQKKPQIDQSQGAPPFETPTIAKGIMNFVLFKFNHLAEKEWNTMFTLAQTFLHSLNNYTFEPPSLKKQASTQEELAVYRDNYIKWMEYCYVPMFCDSFQRLEATTIFGRTLLRSIFKSFKNELLDQCHLRKDRIQPDDRSTILPHLPRFLNLVEEEIYSPTTRIWDESFKAIPPPHVQASMERKRQEAEKRIAAAKLQQSAISHGEPNSDRPTTPSARKDVRMEIGKPIEDATKGRKLSAFASSLNDDNNDTPLELAQQIVADIEMEEESTQRGINSLFQTMKPLDEMTKSAEKNGELRFVLVANSLTKPLTKETMLLLLNLRILFRRQLTSMPPEYITRLLYDPRHKTLALIKDNKPVGGICFRSFPRQGFSEIAFCAIHTSNQAIGYGAHMMNHLKEYHIRIKIYNLLAYADEHAEGYFKKQGFSQPVSLDSSVYEGFIKYYNGATFMHCRLNPRIVYTELSSVLRLQKEVLKRLIDDKGDNVGKIHPGLTYFKEGVKNSIPIELIPGILETGWRPVMRTTRVSKIQEETGDPESLHKSLKIVLTSIKNHKLAWPFQEPVTEALAPDYGDRIKYPMDLKTMSERLKAGYYTTRRLFIADMLRIFNNCRIYNQPNTTYYKCANDLDRIFQKKMKEMGLWDK